MTSTIQSSGYVGLAPLSDRKPAASSPTSPQAATPDLAAQGGQRESVTLSAAAQANAALVKAAQQADGIDHATVSAMKAALAEGSYNVSPDDLANAISVVLRETWR